MRVEHHGRRSKEGQRFTDAFHSIQHQQSDPLTCAGHPQPWLPSGGLSEGALASGRIAVSGSVPVNNVADLVNHLTLVTRSSKVLVRSHQEASGSERSSPLTNWENAGGISTLSSGLEANRSFRDGSLGVRSKQEGSRERRGWYFRPSTPEREQNHFHSWSRSGDSRPSICGWPKHWWHLSLTLLMRLPDGLTRKACACSKGFSRSKVVALSESPILLCLFVVFFFVSEEHKEARASLERI